MREITINPNKARVKGNILANWDEVISKTRWEDYHVSREQLSNLSWNNHNLKAIRLNGKGEVVRLAITADNPSIYPNGSISTLTITTKYSKNNALTALPNHTVYLYDDDTLISTLITDAEGVATFEYSSNVQGTHTITARTPHMNGFEASVARININIIWNVELYLEPKSVYVGQGEIVELKATLLDSQKNPVPDKPIIFNEGVRSLATVTTDENGVATCSYMESQETGIPTEISVTNIPSRFDYGETTTITGTITTADDETPAGEYIRLYCSKDTYAYVLASAKIQTDGSFTFNYTPNTNAKGNYKYYLVYQGVLNYDSVHIVQAANQFVLTDWATSGLQPISIDDDGLLCLTAQNSYLSNYGNYHTYLTGDHWKYVIDVELVGSEPAQLQQIGNNNQLEGNTVLRYINNEWKFLAWLPSSQGSTVLNNQVIPDVINSTYPRNKITFERKDEILKISYTNKATNEKVTLQRNYNQAIAEESRLQMTSSANAYWKVHSLEIERYDPLTFEERSWDFDLNNWKGSGTGSRSIGELGELVLGQQYNYLNTYPTEEHYLNGYKWRITVDIELEGEDSINLQQIYDQNFLEGNTAIRRENNVWKFLAWLPSSQGSTNIKNQIIPDVVNSTYTYNRIIITREDNKITFQYKNKATNELVTLTRSYDSSIAQDSRIVFMSSSNAYWKLKNIFVEQYTRRDNYGTFEPTFKDMGVIPLYIDNVQVDDTDQNL